MAKRSIKWRNSQRELSEQEQIVRLDNGDEGIVTVKQGEILFETPFTATRYSYVALLNLARKGQLPPWAEQVPHVREYIARIFDDERSKGYDPHEKFDNADGRLTHIDLKTGVQVSAPIVDLKRQFERTGKLPRAFSSLKAKQLLGVTA